MKYNVCFILGGPGAGKGSVCEKIVQDYGFVHLSAGELLRQARADPESQFGEQIEQHMKAGSIVPAKITCGLLHQSMLQSNRCSQSVNFLVDGFPRNEDNRRCWDVDMGSTTTLKRVIVLDCPDEICVQRCMGRGTGRIDDNEDTLQRRLRQFKEQCLPIIEYYEAQNLVSHIDASKPLEEVFLQVKRVMLSLDL